MKFLVIPSNRPENLREFFDAWRGRGGWDRVVVVHDGPDCPFVDVGKCYVRGYCWSDIDRILGDDAWIISREDSAIRSFGFLAAYHLGATSVLTLDDDCFPIADYSNTLFEMHHRYMNEHTVWQPSVPYQRTRGIPYKNLGVVDNVKVNVGLWENIGDWDSIQQRPLGYFKPPRGERIVPHGQMIPMCGMNLCFKREAIPLMYFPLQGRGWPYRRFDDIFAGIIAKTLMDRLGWSMSVGEPFVDHRRASDPEVNKVKEAPGLEVNEWFWQEVVQSAEDADYELTDMDISITDKLWALGNSMQCMNNHEYVHKVGAALKTWSTLFTYKLEF